MKHRMTIQRERQPEFSWPHNSLRQEWRGLLPPPTSPLDGILSGDDKTVAEANSCSMSLQEGLTGNNTPTHSGAKGIISLRFTKLPAVPQARGGVS